MSNLPGDSDPRAGAPELRASDADRERVAEVLREAAGEGRLTFDELDERLGAAFAARTYAELEVITRDLPSARPAAAVPAVRYKLGGAPTSRFALSIMGGFGRGGHWVAPGDFTAITIMGGGEIDLREASFAEPQLTIRAFSLMGGIAITVPEDAEVHVHAIGVMGGVGRPPASQGRPGAPRIVVYGLALMGGIDVQRKPPKDEAKRRKLAERDRRRLDRGTHET